MRHIHQLCFIHAGIGKSLFLYYLLWQLACARKTVVWDGPNRLGVVMFSPAGVFQGPLEAFRAELADPKTWCRLIPSDNLVYEGVV